MTDLAAIETHRTIGGRAWRVSDPALPPDIRQTLVNVLMDARRAVKASLKAEDPDAERRARGRVHQAKVALGERGLRWWDVENETQERINERRRAIQRALGDAYPLTDVQAMRLARGENAILIPPYCLR